MIKGWFSQLLEACAYWGWGGLGEFPGGWFCFVVFVLKEARRIFS